MSTPANFQGLPPMIDPDDAVMLLIDHQSGLFQLVRDIEQHVLRGHVTALAKLSRLANLPTFTTASVPDGPNGPLIPEIHHFNPDAVYIARTGQINAWDNPAWVEAIEKTGRKTLLIAGTLTSVCMAFPTISALAAGYKVFAIIDASGNWPKMATDITVARVTQAGAVPIDTYAVLAAVMSTLSCQLLVCSSALTEDFYKALLRKGASQRELVWVGRLMVLVVALIAIAMAANPENRVLGLVSYAWAGFGAAFGPVVLISVIWKHMTRNGALAGILVGAITVIVWKHFELLGLYEIIPGFIFASLAIYFVSKMGAPTVGMVERFDAAEKDYNLNK